MSQDLEMHELHELNSHSQVEDPLTLALFDHLIEQDSQREMDASSSSSSEIVDEEEESSEEDICDSEDSEQLHAAAAAVSGENRKYRNLSKEHNYNNELQIHLLHGFNSSRVSCSALQYLLKNSDFHYVLQMGKRVYKF